MNTGIKKCLLIFGIGFLWIPFSIAQLQTTGWKRATATHFPNDWTNPQNAFGSDDQYAEVLHQSGCRCPFMDLSGDGGTSWSSSNIFGIYGTTDSWRTQGDSTDGWGRSWTDAELSDSNFVLRIWNSSTLLRQGYANFGFNIPAGSTISGIEVRVEARGDSGYTMDYVDVIEIQVYYSLPTAVHEFTTKSGLQSVFPNPATDYISFRFNKLTEIRLIDLQGQVLETKTFETTTGTLDVTRYAPGIYFLQESGGSMTKIIIQ
jgi:hypothetical protein